LIAFQSSDGQFKVRVGNSNKVDFGASNFEAAVQLQIEVKRKMLGRSVTFGVKSGEKCPPRANFFELTTPNMGGLASVCTKCAIRLSGTPFRTKHLYVATKNICQIPNTQTNSKI